MGVISPTNIKWYQCSVWTEGSTHGGDIDTNNEISSGVDQNIFDDVTNQERIDGMTDYRKVFIKNENAATWKAVQAWISQQTEATNDEVSIVLGGEKDTRDDYSLTGTLTFTNGSTTVTGSSTSFTTELGEDDSIQLDSDGVFYEIASVTSDTELELKQSYSETGGSGAGTRQGGANKSYSQPSDKGSGLSIGDLDNNEYQAIWIKREVTAGGDGYTDNTFVLAAEAS